MSLLEVTVGVVGRAHGLRGEVFVTLRTDSAEVRFRPGSEVLADGIPLRVVSFRSQGQRGIVGFEQVKDRAAAEELTGVELTARVMVDESPADSAEFYDYQLVGLRVVRSQPEDDHDGRPTGEPVLAGSSPGCSLGEIVRVEHLGFQDMLVVSTLSGERFVPFVDALVPEVDLAAGLVRVNAIPGLLEDINET